jgi:hypothetical protein
VLLDFQGEMLRLPAHVEIDGERLVDGRNGVGGELDVNDRADDLGDFASVHDMGDEMIGLISLIRRIRPI